MIARSTVCSIVPVALQLPLPRWHGLLMRRMMTFLVGIALDTPDGHAQTITIVESKTQ